MDPLTSDLLAARDGDRLALAAAVRRSQAEVYRLCAALIGRTDAEDLTQETYVRAVRALPAFRGDASGRTWLLSIARRTCIDEIRRRTRRRRRAEPAPLGVVSDPGLGVALEELLQQLDPQQRAAFVCTQIVGLSYEEAAQACGVPIGTIRSRVARARAALVAELRAADAV